MVWEINHVFTIYKYIFKLDTELDFIMNITMLE